MRAGVRSKPWLAALAPVAPCAWVLVASLSWVPAALALPTCPVEPFGDEGLNVREDLLRRGCGGDSTHWQVETPRAKPSDPGPSLLRTNVDRVVSERMADGLLGSVRLTWAGLRQETEGGGLRTERAAVAAGGLLRLGGNLAMQVNLGRDMAGAGRSRATVASIWQPLRRGLVFAEWAGSGEGTENHRVGARLWLIPRRLAFDFNARQLPDGSGWTDRRFGLSLDVTP